MVTNGTKKRATWPVWSVGLRPFYLAAALYGVLILPLWVMFYQGFLVSRGYMSGIDWHIHEMIFGFAVAVIAGFLLTAVRNWTGRETARGGFLAALVLLWLAGRVLVLTPWAGLAAAVDLLFLPVLAITLARPLLQSGNRRNYFVVSILLLLTVANLLIHVEALGRVAVNARLGATLALDIIAVLLAMIGGRVIPIFTGHVIGREKIRQFQLLEVFAIAPLILVVFGDLMRSVMVVSDALIAALLLLAAVAHFVRLSHWAPLSTIGRPILWAMHIAYLWLPIAFALRAWSLLDPAVPAAVAVHALTIGAMSGLMLAMMGRSARGHTGRPLIAGRLEIISYLLIPLATLCRILPPLVIPGWTLGGVVLSGIFWTLAFLLFLVSFTRPLLTPRADGRTD